ncbi:MAG TPA: hypothetical protein VFO76_04300 [Candidatus Kapabacteria bacterium]|nr:hypothetical protein [Candidatus Kapabacteria bacterium]
MRLIAVLLLIIFSSEQISAQRFNHVSALRWVADSMVVAAVGTDNYGTRVIPLPEKTIVRKAIDNRWVHLVEGDRDSIIDGEYTADFYYRVYPPDRHDIHSLLYVSLIVHADTLIYSPRELSGLVSHTVTMPPNYGTWPRLFSRTKDLEHHAIENANRELSRIFGKEIFDKEFRLYQTLVYPMMQGYYDDENNEYQIPYDHRVVYFIRSPFDSMVAAGITFYTYPDDSYDTAAFKKEMDELPDCLITGTNGNVLTKELAITRALELGLPEGKLGPKYKTLFRREGKTFIWQVLSIDDYRYHVDLIGHPCEYSGGELMKIDAISGKLLDRHKDGISEGCMD